MSVYEPNSRHLREVLIFCFNMKKSAAEAHQMLSNTYGEATISERTCREWFQRFKNGDFNVEDRHSDGREKVFEDAELEALLDQDSCQNQEELARSLEVTQQAISKRLQVVGMIQKQGNWVPYELKSRDVTAFVCL
ncbi:Mariner Mos1 transposase [Acromyrmex echinatior]|uniref:Mariner Mos1 transposase n=1 Tax=Acromyrmex echinatior TaxID=103372 RepID=F4X2M2_ACREC|nr:Mariner Mos1 transposase [Acromyrmex echinatior]